MDHPVPRILIVEDDQRLAQIKKEKGFGFGVALQRIERVLSLIHI